VQCRQSGWDPRAGSRFVVEFERSAVPKIASSGDRNRIWYLLDELRRQEALNINSDVAQTLPPPDNSFASSLPPDVREHYLRQFAPSTKTVKSTDVWFCYYDETDAHAWAEFLSRTIDSALQTFLAQPPSLMGWRPSKAGGVR
jgi:hypothetical protein